MKKDATHAINKWKKFEEIVTSYGRHENVDHEIKKNTAGRLRNRLGVKHNLNPSQTLTDKNY